MILAEHKAKMFLFGRWMATCYADTHMDNNGRCEHDYGFDEHNAMSVLNRTGGDWWKDKVTEFNNVVLPNYKKNGSYKDALNFFKE